MLHQDALDNVGEMRSLSNAERALLPPERQEMYTYYGAHPDRHIAANFCRTHYLTFAFLNPQFHQVLQANVLGTRAYYGKYQKAMSVDLFLSPRLDKYRRDTNQACHYMFKAAKDGKDDLQEKLRLILAFHCKRCDDTHAIMVSALLLTKAAFGGIAFRD